MGPNGLDILDVYPFHSEDGKQAGTVSAFLRVSCFGKLIVTHFEVKEKEKFSFKGMDQEKADALASGVKFGPSTKDGQGGQGQADGGQGQGQGQGPGMNPGMGYGMGPGMGMYPGMGPGMYGAGQVSGPCPGPKPWLHGKKGVLPCGEQACPAGNCGHFPCSHAIPCNSPPCVQMMCGPGACQQPSCVQMCPGAGMSPGMGMGMVCPPANMNTQVTEEDIAATLKPPSSTSDKKKSVKGKGKGKKK